MGLFDIALLLEPVSDDVPGGDDLEYDQKFIELGLKAHGTPDRVEIVRDPDDSSRDIERIVPGKEPDAPSLLEAALALFKRTKDLRVAMYVVYAATRIDGLAGLSSGTGLIAGMLERYWDEVHPRLDPEEEFDPFMRINILNGLCDPTTLLRAVKNAPLVEARAVGRFTLRDMDVANGEAAPLDGQVVATPELLRAACMESDREVLELRLAACKSALDNLESIESKFNVHAASSPNFDQMKKILQCAQAIYMGAAGESYVSRNAQLEPTPEYAEPVRRDGLEKISSRADARRCLEQVCNYLEQAEPAHPSPLLIRRAIRLLDMSFLDIMRELTPDAVSEIERLGGIRN